MEMRSSKCLNNVFSFSIGVPLFIDEVMIIAVKNIKLITLYL